MQLKKNFDGNYNSIDLTEVEQFDDNSGLRNPSSNLLQLRSYLVDGIEDAMHDIKIKYHYDDRRRISREVYDYYFSPLVNTSFSIGLAIPNTHGNFSIKVGDEIGKNKHTNTNITSFFNGSNWKIQPAWIYCKYHYLEGHEFPTPEEELLHFLRKMFDDDFKWVKQYEPTGRDLGEIECGRKTLDEGDYYCDEQLVQRLVFDAKNTVSTFNNSWKANNSKDQNLVKLYNATLRFVATMSGLTRWEYINGQENGTKNDFGEQHSKAISETWYKSAVLQHQYNPHSFVYSVPFDIEGHADVPVTASYAIFPMDASIKAPGSVVGYQFSQHHLEKRFYQISQETRADKSCPDCSACGTVLDCYIIDNSGYILISANKSESGNFFGEIEGAVMESMLQRGIFDKVTLYDYQAMCKDELLDGFLKSDANWLLSPFIYLKWTFQWIISEMLWLMFETEIHQLFNSQWVLANHIEEFSLPTYSATFKTDVLKRTKRNEKEQIVDDEYECETERNLYIFNQSKVFSGLLNNSCSRPFYAKRIPHSNLLLIVVNSSYSQCSIKHSTEPKKVIYDELYFSCHKLYLNNLSRRHLQGCFNEHPLEHEIKTCGESNKLSVNLNLVSVLIILYVICNLCLY